MNTTCLIIQRRSATWPHQHAVLEHVDLVGLLHVGAVLQDGQHDGVAHRGPGAQRMDQPLQRQQHLDADQALALERRPHLHHAEAEKIGSLFCTGEKDN